MNLAHVASCLTALNQLSNGKDAHECVIVSKGAKTSEENLIDAVLAYWYSIITLFSKPVEKFAMIATPYLRKPYFYFESASGVPRNPTTP